MVKILLVNPPIYDFSAYDFWLKPYGLLRVAGYLRGQAELQLFDFLDRFHPLLPKETQPFGDCWGRGKFYAEVAEKPLAFSDIPRNYKRYGLQGRAFEDFLAAEKPFDYALIQTTMTYWYPGTKEVLDSLRKISPQTKTILGGVYATLCPGHARSLGADLVVEGLELESLWNFLQLKPNYDEPPFWEGYGILATAVVKLADGCPFRCTYCSVPQVYPKFVARPLAHSLRELEAGIHRGAENMAFYDDALLFLPQKILLPFLEKVLRLGHTVNFHTPNALNARFITQEIADVMVAAGFRHFYLGFESSSFVWQRKTGGKVYSDELVSAVDKLRQAGADSRRITAYLILGHPQGNEQDLEASMQFANALGIRVMLSEFSPIPGTPDGEKCRTWLDLDEPLRHNKTAFTHWFLGASQVQRFKNLCNELNSTVTGHP